MVKKIYFGLVLAFILVSVFALAEDFLPAVIPEGQEVFNLGYKHSSYSNVITSTKPYISCVWKPDSIDDGWKSCEAIFEVGNQNSLKSKLNNPQTDFVFKMNNIKNKAITFSDKYNPVPETYTEVVVQEDAEGNLEGVEQAHTFTKKQFYGFTKLSEQIDISKPFAIKISYEAPKYSDNQFNFSLSGKDFQVSIDPDQSACGTLNIDGATYTLNQSVGSIGTCFTIGASNIVLDCQGNDIIYAVDGILGYGVENLGYSNVTIKNCNVLEGNASTSYKHAIYFNHAANGIILNNTLTIIGGLSNGIFLINNSDFTDLFWNNITTSSSTANGIRLMNSSQSSISNNIITTSAAGAPGIELRTASNFNLLDSNTITTAGSGGYGIYLRMNSSDNTLLNNYISSSYANTPEIYDITGNSFINYLVYNNSYGEIKWENTSDNGFLKDMDVDGAIGLGTNLFIGNHTLALNTSAFGTSSKINSSANITFYGSSFNAIDEVKRLGGYSTNNSEIITSGINCIGVSCNVISYVNGTLRLNTTSFSSFAVAGLYEVDVYNLSQIYTNSSHYSVLRFFMRNIANYANLFNWSLSTDGNTVQSTIPTNLIANENIFIFVEHNYPASGIYAVVANGTTSNEVDSEEVQVSVG